MAALSQVPGAAPGVPSFSAAEGDALALLLRDVAQGGAGAPVPAAADVAVLRERARARAAAGDHVAAAEHFELLCALDPRDGEALAGLALARLALGAAGAAEELAAAAVAAAPRSAAAHRALGQACAALGRPDTAAAALRTALVLALEAPAGARDETALQAARIAEFRGLWSCADVRGEPVLEHPVLLCGHGRIEFGADVCFGWPRSPGFLSEYAYVEAGSADSVVRIGDGSFFNNGVALRSEGPGIDIGPRALIGNGVHVYDSDFHAIDPARRWGGLGAVAHVEIGPNVWLGSNAMVLKGVTIGADTVVGAGAVVTRPLPAGVIAGGNPARVIRSL